MADVVTTVQIAQETLGPVGDPLDGAAEYSRRVQSNDSFALQKEFEAECTANIGRNDMQHLRCDIDAMENAIV